MKTTFPSKTIATGRARSSVAAVVPQRQNPPAAASPLRQFKVLQSGHAPAQLSLLLRPAGAR